MRLITASTLLLLLGITSHSSAQEEQKNRALLVIDIQDFYFPGGRLALLEPEKASAKAAILLDHFRKNNGLIIHVRHNSESGGNIHQSVLPLENEKIISKSEINSFKGTDLKEFLDSHQVKELIICGMQTHMCVEAATRAASDFGYKCTLIHDACTTRDLTFQDHTVKAMDVHYSTLNTLKNYAKIVSLAEFLESENK